MFLIIGLGNPGKRYENTWHNLGFLAVDEFQEKNNFPSFVFSQKFNCLISESVFDSKKILLAKPQTFMNQIGQAVKSLLTNHRHKIAMAMLLRNLIVTHDDADLPKGEIRISKDRGTAGHKGLDSIVGVLKTRNFVRIRIGVRPKNYVPGSKSLNRFVLKKFTKLEEKMVAEVIQRVNQAIEMILEKGLMETMNKFNA
ncbi:aminoacyl-tRNA hydrolase [Patescibacteria group bacterium]|nr:aminoacyl-tRNA hydrolase [Patescibacteria group bacterium]